MTMRTIAALVLIAVALPAWAQGPSERRPGIAVDAAGGPVIDPTKNVLDLVLAAVKRLDDVMAAYMKRQDDLREADTKRNNDLREAETRRINELASQKQAFDLELARINKSNVDASALLLATAVKELKTDSSDRTAKLEQFANEQRGRTTAGNEVWALIGVLAMLLLVAIGVIVNMVKTIPHRGGMMPTTSLENQALLTEILRNTRRREPKTEGAA